MSMSYVDTLFTDITFVLGNNEKVGLVGLNGTGKTTLLKVIAGLENPTKGEVHLVGESLGYLPQIFDLTNNGTHKYLGEYLESLVDNTYTDMWRVHKALSEVSFGELDEFQEIETLSPGQKMKVYLVKILLEEPSILLIDEPTNHLDIKGIEWFESFLSSFDGICITISHDRAFLKNTVTHIFEIDSQQLFVYDGNYDDFVEKKAERIEEQNKQYRLQESKREKLENLVKKMRKESKDGRSVRAAKKRLEREVEGQEVSRYKKERVKEIHLSGSVHRKKRILKVENLTFSYEKDTKIFDDLNFQMHGSEMVWIQGANGAGKSTFIKLLVGNLEPDEGEITWGKSVLYSYFAQEQTETMRNKSVHDYFFEQTKLRWDEAYSVLDSFLFSKQLRKQKVKNLSPGQKARLTFAIFSQKEFECLILDEPTNHLDIETKEVIEDAIRNYQGAVILVSHDRYFAKAVKPDRVLALEQGGLAAV